MAYYKGEKVLSEQKTVKVDEAFPLTTREITEGFEYACLKIRTDPKYSMSVDFKEAAETLINLFSENCGLRKDMRVSYPELNPDDFFYDTYLGPLPDEDNE